MDAKQKKIRKQDVEKIIKNNPNIDRSLFMKNQKELRKLRKEGFAKSGFDLVIPYSRSVGPIPD